MPELDDTVFAYFPSKEEGDGVTLNSVRTKGLSGDKISDHKIKYFRTIDGKELKFSPEEILITCTDDEINLTCKSSNIKMDGDILVQGKEVKNN
jgi:hypothetical protein